MDWLHYILAVIVCICLVYVPGYLFVRAFRLVRTAALALAPAYSAAAFCIAGIACQMLGVFASPLTVAGPALLVAVAALAFSSAVSRLRPSSRRHVGAESSASASTRSPEDASWLFAPRVPRDVRATAVLYVAIGVAVTVFVYTSASHGPDTFIHYWDNVHHFNMVESFVVSGDWSSLGANVYPEGWASDLGLATPSFYPAGWQTLTTLVLATSHVSAAVAGNAVNFVYVGIVLPLGTFLLLSVLFPTRRLAVRYGAVLVLAFVAFPWGILVHWPVYPNLFALVYVPLFAACFISLFGSGSRRQRCALAIVACICLVSSVFMQPNGAFTAAVFLIPFCAGRCARFVASHAPASHRRAASVAGACAFLLVAAVFWTLCYRVPFMREVVEYFWPPTQDPLGGLLRIVSLALSRPTVQPLLSVLVAAGIAFTFSRRRFLWLTFSFLFAAAIFYVSAVFDDTLAKHFLSGFWYTDPYRPAAFTAMFAVPLAALGAYAVHRLVARWLEGRAAARERASATGVRRAATGSRALCAILCAAIAAVTFLPGAIVGPYATYLPFGAVKARVSEKTDSGFVDVYDREKRMFVRAAKSLVPPGATVVNLPHDGSLYAYGLDGLPTFYRKMGGYGRPEESEASRLVRRQLRDVARNDEVRDVLRRAHARFAIVLDDDHDMMRSEFAGAYLPTQWKGVERIDSDTPGFRCVLQSGKMRLYEITAVG